MIFNQQHKGENKMKLHYTKKELVNLGWATIGGRIEDYQEIFYKNGCRGTYRAIELRYGDNNTPGVYRGLLVHMKFGTDAYYDAHLLAG